MCVLKSTVCNPHARHTVQSATYTRLGRSRRLTGSRHDHNVNALTSWHGASNAPTAKRMPIWKTDVGSALQRRHPQRESPCARASAACRSPSSASDSATPPLSSTWPCCPRSDAATAGSPPRSCPVRVQACDSAVVTCSTTNVAQSWLRACSDTNADCSAQGLHEQSSLRRELAA
jgi:hypothetical protein